MTTQFDPEDHLVIVTATIEGPEGRAVVEVALDTGATRTLIDRDVLVSVGYELDEDCDSIPIVTASGNADVPVIPVSHLEALAQSKEDFPVIAYTLPANAGIDGLLGLDFVRDRILTVDFPNATITLN